MTDETIGFRATHRRTLVLTARLVLLPVLMAVVLMAAFPVSAAERRVALVLGNGAYSQVAKLTNPPRDAKAMAVALQGLGFTVIEGYDLGIDSMLERIHAFGQAADGAAIALVFYAGHGLQVAGRNYLLPVDAKLQRETDLRREAVEVDEILGEARQAKRLRIVILDACRDNPFLAQMARSLGTRSALVGRGFARIEDVEADTLIAFATKADAVAEDGTTGHSPYTTALLQHLTTPGLSVERFFGKVRDSVVANTQGRQQPFVYGSLGGDPIYLTHGEPPRSAGNGAGTAAVAAAAPDKAADATELAFWDALKTSANPADYQAYLDTYPNGRFVALARVRAQPSTATVAATTVAATTVAATTVAATAAAMGEAPTGAASRMVTPSGPPTLPAAPAPGARPTKFDSAKLAMANLNLDCTRFTAAEDQTACQQAKSGTIPAVTGLAARFASGRGVERNEAEAARLYRAAAESGDAEAETGLGQLLEDGRGLPADPGAALGWYRQAAGQGYANAQYALGVMLETGHGVPQNLTEAAQWYRRAAEQGNADAQVTLGLLLEHGHGLPADPVEAVRQYRLAAEQGNPLGQAYLATMLEQGQGVAQNRTEALRYFQLAAAQGNVVAKAALARLATTAGSDPSGELR